MQPQMNRTVISLVVLLATAAASIGEIQVQPDKENVVASKLEGRWELDAELTKRLDGRGEGKISFKSDATVAAKIPAKYEKFFKDKRIYMAGVMTRQGIDHPFVLIERKGNAHLVYFQERDGDPFGDAESFNVMLAVARDTQNDLLFIGGDFNNQPFAAYRRVKP